MAQKVYVVTLTEYDAKDNYLDCSTEVFDNELQARKRVDELSSEAIDFAPKHGGLDDGGELSGVYGYVSYYLNDDIVKVKFEEMEVK